MLGKGGRGFKSDEISSRDVASVHILGNEAAGVSYNVSPEVLVKNLVGSYEMVD